MGNMSGLRVDSVSVDVAGKRLVNGASFTAASSQVTCLIGPNGAGKTTLLKAIAGIVPFVGNVQVDGEDVRQWKTLQRAMRIGYVPQRTRISLPFSAIEVVSHGLYAEAGDAWTSPPNQRERASAALAEVGMAPFAHRVFSTLSGGEQQLVLLARALVGRPRLLLLDEPASALDIGHRLDLDERLRSLSRQDFIVVAVLHDLAQVSEVADRVVLLSGNTVADVGSPSEVLTGRICELAFGVQMLRGRGPAFRRLAEER